MTLRLGSPDSSRAVLKGLIACADTARDEKRYRDAAVLYAEALRIGPDNPGLLIQCGHMLKESGDFGGAEERYRLAKTFVPRDPDLSLQIGHLLKVAGRFDEAQTAYQEAQNLRPGWTEPALELERLAEERRIRAPTLADAAERLDRRRFAQSLTPSLVRRNPGELLVAHQEWIDIRRLGRDEPFNGDMLPTLRGVEALRGFCVSATPIVELQILVDNRVIHRGPLKGGYRLDFERDRSDLLKYVFNVWFDFAGFSLGLHEIEWRFIDLRQRARSVRRQVVVAAPLSESEFPGCDGVVSPVRSGELSLEDTINRRPSVVRKPPRPLFDEPPRTILVMRTDQLGDMVSAVPAMRRLRELAPDAHIVGLLTSANADLARALGLIDEVIVVEFPDDEFERRRLMSLEKQEELRQRLAPYNFDLAIDLADAQVSRHLLLLSGARVLYGTGDGSYRFLTLGFDFNSHDVRNGMNFVPHSSKTLAMIEALGATLKVNNDPLPLAASARSRLKALNIGERLSRLQRRDHADLWRQPLPG